MGEIEGMHYQIVQKKFKEKYDAWRSLDEKYLDLSFQGGESKREVRTRIFNALSEYTQKTNYKHIAIAGHGILISQILLTINQSFENIQNGSILHISFQDNNWQFEEFLNP